MKLSNLAMETDIGPKREGEGVIMDTDYRSSRSEYLDL